MNRNKRQKSERNTSWEPLAAWYDGWMGAKGSRHHRQFAIPALLRLMHLTAQDRVLDLGAGQGVLAPHVAKVGAAYVGVDLSHSMMRTARKHHGRLPKVRFVQGDVKALSTLPSLKKGSFTTAVFLLSIQDMEPLDEVLRAASWALAQNGRLLILMTHPCFRVPRQSGWGWDAERKLRFRRVDRYLTKLAVPLKKFPGQKKGKSRSFHRPLQDYVNAMGQNGLFIDNIVEIPVPVDEKNGRRADKLAQQEIPLFLGIRGIKK